MARINKDNRDYDVIIVGAGIVGTALFYVLSNYTNIKRLALIEKCKGVGEVNSHFNSNSQTLHFGDIETNYTLEKAGRVKEAAGMFARYLEKYAKDSFLKQPKMVLGVGEKEVAELENRYEEFKTLFPKLKKISSEEIALIEPKVVQSRKTGEKILALCVEEAYAVNFKKAAESFVREAIKNNKDKNIDVFLGTKVQNIKKIDSGYLITADQRFLTAKAVVFAAGPHSLLFARSLGYGNEYGLLPVAGNFYIAKDILNGKVYRVQIKKLPFAAVHGDPDVNNPSETRFGPTAKVLPLLERRKYKSFFDFLKTSVWSIRGGLSLLAILSDPTILKYVSRNLLYDFPFVGKWLFLKEVRKIIPALRYKDIRFGRGLGGIRPQIVNINSKKLEMGEAEIIGDNIIFNIAPSPGASVAFKNAEQSVLKIMKFLKPPFLFYQDRWCKDFRSTMIECRE